MRKSFEVGDFAILDHKYMVRVLDRTLTGQDVYLYKVESITPGDWFIREEVSISQLTRAGL